MLLPEKSFARGIHCGWAYTFWIASGGRQAAKRAVCPKRRDWRRCAAGGFVPDEEEVEAEGSETADWGVVGEISLAILTGSMREEVSC